MLPGFYMVRVVRTLSFLYLGIYLQSGLAVTIVGGAERNQER